MNNFWYVKSDFKISDNLNEISLSLKSKRLPRIKIGDGVIILSDRNFSAYGYVSKTQDEQVTQEPIYHNFILVIGKIKELKPLHSISDFAYSLPRIYKHFTNPYRHFIRSYGHLRSIEFDYIINNDFFIARTACGKLINALHTDHKAEFIKLLAKENDQIIDNNSLDYYNVLSLLTKYIEKNILSHASMIISSNEILSKLNFPDLGFIDPEIEQKNSRPDLISVQADLIKKSEQKLERNLGFISKSVIDLQQNEKIKNKIFNDYWFPRILNY